MKKYNTFILEKNHIPNNIFNFVEDVISNDIVLNNYTKKYKMKYDDINASIILNVNFISSDKEEYNGDIQFQRVISNKFNDVVINIYIYSNKVDINKIKSTIIHELIHLYELYQIKDFFIDTSWSKHKSLIDSKEQNKIKIFKYYRDLFYLTLQHELNARVSSVRFKLYKKDKETLIDELYKTPEWQKLLSMKEFNPKQYTKDLIDILGLEQSVYLVNEFCFFMNKKTKVSNEIDLLNYFNNYKRYCNHIYNSHKNKLLNVVSSLIKIDENICCDPILHEYKWYLNENNREKKLERILLIDFINYI